MYLNYKILCNGFHTHIEHFSWSTYLRHKESVQSKGMWCTNWFLANAIIGWSVENALSDRMDTWRGRVGPCNVKMRKPFMFALVGSHRRSSNNHLLLFDKTGSETLLVRTVLRRYLRSCFALPLFYQIKIISFLVSVTKFCLINVIFPN